MSGESPAIAAGIAGGDLPDTYSTPSCVYRLREALQSCDHSFTSGDSSGSEAAVTELVDLLNSVLDQSLSSADAIQQDRLSEDLLSELHSYLYSASSSQEAIDSLSLELPKIVAKFGAVSQKCREMSANIIKLLVSKCSPRDTLSILCEALDSQIGVSIEPVVYYILLFDGLAQVLILIQRRQIEHVKVVLPIVLIVLRATVSSGFFEEKEFEKINNKIELFGSAIRIGRSIQEICNNMEGKKKAELRAILGLYVLQNIALVSKIRQNQIISSCDSIILNLSKFLSFCEFSYFELITGSNVDSAKSEISKWEDDEFMDYFSLAMDGAALAVLWGYICDEIAKSTGEDVKLLVLEKVKKNHTQKLQAIVTLKYVLSSTDYSWEIKDRTLDLLLDLIDDNNLVELDDNCTDFSSFVPSIFVTLQAIERIMIGGLDPKLRKKAFSALKMVITVMPSSDRFEMLKALIIKSDSPSLTGILIDVVREEIITENKKYIKSTENHQTENGIKYLFWKSRGLEFVEMIVRPPEGGPPSLPDHFEPVLSALNLLRFILIVDSTGKSNNTKVLTKETLQKVYSDWLLPLRTLVTGIHAENERGNNELADHIVCALNPVQLVLYRCIELVEDSMKHF